MFIRHLQRTDKKTKKVYDEYRIVESVRTPEKKVVQRIILNLGTGFKLAPQHWKKLTKRIKDIMSGQMELFDTTPDIDSLAQFYAKKIIVKQATKKINPKHTSQIDSSYELVDVNNLHHHTVRTIGGEHVGLSQLKEFQLEEKLAQIGFNQSQIRIAIGQILGRLLNPGSELSTYGWLRKASGLEELLGCDFSMIGKDQLYRASDLLLKHKSAIETHLYKRERNLFQLTDTITLYDLTNTYFEGTAKNNQKAQFGRSKEKRSDCRLVSLGLVLDGEGFLKHSDVFAGNVSEPKTLAGILEKLTKCCEQDKPMIIMDAGIAVEENITALKAQGYDFIVVSRKQKKAMPTEGEPLLVKEVGDNKVTVKQVVNDETKELEVYCHSTLKAEKDRSIRSKACLRFEAELEKIANALNKKNGLKATDKVTERIGRAKEKYKRVAKFYTIELTQDSKGKKITQIQWNKQDDDHFDGVYCLRCSRSDLNAQQIWKTYTILTEVEAAFRCMKSELGMRPVFHQKTNRVDAHLLITLLAYHVLHSIRYKLKRHNINASWHKIRETLNSHMRLTTTMQRKDGKTIHIRKTALPDVDQREIYDALNLAYYPGDTLKTVC